jgi:hypothetical protein
MTPLAFPSRSSCNLMTAAAPLPYSAASAAAA